MALRASKPSFNVREKLTELGRRFGLKGSELVSAETVQEARDLVSAGRKNIIINGAMQVAQRGTVVNAGNEYGGPDRYKFAKNDGAYTISQDSDVPSGSGFARSFKIDVTSAASSTGQQYVLLRQMLEGQDLQQLKKGTSSAESFTLQFWVKSTKTGTYVIQVYDYDTSPVRQICKTYTVNSSNTWEYKTLTFPGDTIGAFDNDRNVSIEINWWLYAGSTYSSGTLQTSWGTYSDANAAVGQVNAVDSTSNNIFFTGIQLEVGKNATEFEHRPYGEELALCQRYYWEIGSYLTGNWAPLSLFIGGAATRAFGSIRTPVTMRAHPAITFSNVNLHSTYTENVTNLYRYAQTGRNEEYDGLAFEANTASGLVGGQVYRLHIKNVSGTSGYIRFNAEL